METYPGEPIRIRLLDGAHEEQHVLNITGMPWRKEIADIKSPLVQSQTIGISEAFNIQISEPYAAGDWIEVTLHNLFDPKKPIKYHDYPSVPLAFPHEPSNRVSLSPQFLKYDPVCSSGINVGYNTSEQTAAPGECIKYLWHADREYGTILLNSFGDLRNHRYHGLFEAIIIEPTGALYYNGIRQTDENYNENAVITAPGTETFREFVLFAHNGIRLLDKNNRLIKTTEQDLTGEEASHEAPDHEDTDEKGYNYRSERFLNRLKQIPAISKIFDSKVHGDPATPLLKATPHNDCVQIAPSDFSSACINPTQEYRRILRRICAR